MANIIKLGSLCLDDHLMAAGREYIPGQRISIKDTKPGNELCWVVVNGLLIADRCLLTNISWDNLEQQGMVFGKQLCIDRAKYLCRLLKLGNQKGIQSEWTTALAAVGDDSDELWHWNEKFTWGQESSSKYEVRRATCGYSSADEWCGILSSVRNSHTGFRPVLEPKFSDFSELKAGAELQVWVNQQIIRGRLVELTDYDVVLACEGNSHADKKDLKLIAAARPEGLIIARDNVRGAQVLDD